MKKLISRFMGCIRRLQVVNRIERLQVVNRIERWWIDRKFAEGYRANADLDRQICEEFAHSDFEALEIGEREFLGNRAEKP